MKKYYSKKLFSESIYVHVFIKTLLSLKYERKGKDDGDNFGNVF